MTVVIYAVVAILVVCAYFYAYWAGYCDGAYAGFKNGCRRQRQKDEQELANIHHT